MPPENNISPQASEPRSSFWKWKNLAIGLLAFSLGLPALLFLGIFSFLSVVVNDGGQSPFTILGEIIAGLFVPIWPVLIMFAILWLVSLVLYVLKKYKLTIIVQVVLYFLAGLWIHSLLVTQSKTTQEAVHENSSQSTIAPTFFIPTAQSIPSGFSETKKQYTASSYEEDYNDSSGSISSITFMESNVPQLSYSSAYAKSIQTEGISAYGTHMNFNFEGSPGIIFSRPVMGAATTDASNYVYYELIWDDNGKALYILEDAPKTSSPQDVINILNTMTHS